VIHVETVSFDRAGQVIQVEPPWQSCCRCKTGCARGYALSCVRLGGPEWTANSVFQATALGVVMGISRSPRMHAAQTVSTVIVRKHALPRWAEINHRIPEMRRSNAGI
jgi:hypothetical protein